MLAKALQVLDPAYLLHCRLGPCFNVKECGALVAGQAHHTKGKGMGGATYRDDSAVGACMRCHMRCHGQRVDGLNPIPRDVQKLSAYLSRRHYLALQEVAIETVPW